jgi:hypothetical protein
MKPTQASEFKRGNRRSRNLAEFDIISSPVRNIQRLDFGLNPSQLINYTAFIPPSITDEQYIIPDRQIGVAIQSVEVLDAIANGSIAVLGSGRLVVV